MMAGRLSDRVVLIEPMPSIDDFGGHAHQQWIEWPFSIAAQIMTPSAANRFAQGADRAVQNTQVRLRWPLRDFNGETRIPSAGWRVRQIRRLGDAIYTVRGVVLYQDSLVLAVESIEPAPSGTGVL